ncbi:thioredoxin 1 [Fontibacillus solani]|uniref:Thioredoxin n=1 Tax=Fontibacillus solani TaxID=1572857 RepID=A0A7W3XSE2_9BACL|nr:thioredoxin family protein [Fontibacillus solani]MBA9086642.1 thioredoxin 1 [Fontibacillus solani]
MSIVAVNDNNFASVIPAKGTTLVEFGAVWCPPCKALLPILDDLSNKHAERLTVVKIDCDESPVTAGAYGIMSMPTVIVFQDGEPVEKLVGLRPQSAYENVLSKYMTAV